MGLFAKSSTSGTWPTVKKLFVKSSTSGTWPTVKKAFAKTVGGWVQFWPKSGPYTTTSPLISTLASDLSGTSQPPGYTLDYGSTYYGQRGIWEANSGTATISSYSYTIYSSTSAAPGAAPLTIMGSGSLSGNSATILLTNGTTSGTTYEGKYLIFSVSATRTDNVVGTDSTDSQTYRYFVCVKNPPAQASGYTPSISASVTSSTTTQSGGILVSRGAPITFTYINSWNGTNNYLPDSTRSSIKWYSSTVGTYTTSAQLTASATSISTGITTSAPSNNGTIYTTTSTHVTGSVITNGSYYYVVDSQQNSNTDYNVSGAVEKITKFGPIQVSPSPSTQPTLTAVSPFGYIGKTNSFTEGGVVYGNTGIWSPVPNGLNPVVSSFKYSTTSPITNQVNWNLFTDGIQSSGIFYNIQDSTQNINHSFTIPGLIYDISNNPYTFIGKYLEYSISVQNGTGALASDFYTNSQLIYSKPYPTGAPTLTFLANNSATVYWAQNLYTSSYYILQWSATDSLIDSNWTNLGSNVTTNPTQSSQITYTGLPSGSNYYRVIAYNADGVGIKSTGNTLYNSTPPPVVTISIDYGIEFLATGSITVNSTNATSITATVYRTSSSGTAYSVFDTATGGTTKLIYDIRSRGYYYLSITATNSYGTTNVSSDASFNFFYAGIAIGTLSRSAVASTTALSVDISWTPNTFTNAFGRTSNNVTYTNNIASYDVLRTIPPITGVTATGTGSVMTYTTSSAHNLSAGQTVTVSGMSIAGYNVTGTVVSVPSTTTFTISGSVTGSATGGTASTAPLSSATPTITLIGGNTAFDSAANLLQYSKNYYYWVRAVNQETSSAWQFANSVITKSPTSYTYNFENTFYVGTNGFINFDTTAIYSAVPVTVGVLDRTLSYLGADLIQDQLSWASILDLGINWLVLYWSGHRSGGLVNEAKIEIWIPSGGTWAWINYGFGSGLSWSSFLANSYPGFYSDGAALSNTTHNMLNGEQLKLNFNGTGPSGYTLLFTPKGSTWGGWQSINLTGGTLDEGYTALTISAPSSPSEPTSIIQPTGGNLGTTTAFVSWSTPSSKGGSQILSYDYSLSTNGGASYGAWISTGINNYISLTLLQSAQQYYIRVRATNYGGFTGTSYATTFFTTLTASTPPTGGSATISGTAQQGQTLTATVTNATGNPTPTYTYQWQVNNGSAATYTNVSGATASTFIPGSFEAGYSARVVVTFTNGVAPNQVYTSAGTGIITPIYWNISYDTTSNGGTGTIATTQVIQGKTTNVTSTVPTKSGSTFSSWNTSLGGGGTSYASAASITPTADITLYAQYSVVVASVTSIQGSTGGGGGSGVTWSDPKSTMVYVFSNVTSATARIQRSVDNITWTSGVTETLSISSNSATQTTNQPVGNTSTSANYYYRAQVLSLNGTAVTITSASIRNTLTPKVNITLYP
jgi:hypothetical protein